jgi:teichuronic acid biosynthesis glycosyltransferase TuaC
MEARALGASRGAGHAPSARHVQGADRTWRRALPLRVLAVIPGGPAGASMIFARRQMEAVARLGVEVRTVYLGKAWSPAVLPGLLRLLRREIASFDPDVVHAHFGTATGLLCAAATRRPLVVTYRGSDLNACPAIPPWRSRVGRLCSQLAALRARRIVCVSEQLRRRLWWRRGRATVLPSGVDVDLFRPLPQAQARARMGWTHDRPAVLFNAGREPAVKRLDVAQAAVEAARVLVPDLELVVMWGDVDPQRVPLLMNGCDCLLLTSDHEGSPNVVKEAMACGLPVVSVDVGDVRARLAGVQPTRIVPQEAAALGAAIAELAPHRVRSNGPQAARELSQATLARTLLEVYAAALE